MGPCRGSFGLRIIKATTDEPLDRIQGACWIGDGLSAGNLPNQALVVVTERNNRWCRAGTFIIGDDHWIPMLNDRDTGVGGPKINTDHSWHVDVLRGTFTELTTPLYDQSFFQSGVDDD
jgi:hypothetical protein